MVDAPPGLDYSAGRPTPKTLRRLRLALATLTLLAASAVVVWQTGAIAPRLEWSGSGWSSGSSPGEISFTVPVENKGWVPVKIIGIGQSGPGLDVAPALQGLLPYTLSPGEIIELSVTYHFTDCVATEHIWPIAIHLERPWGGQTAYLQELSPDLLPCKAAADQG